MGIKFDKLDSKECEIFQNALKLRNIPGEIMTQVLEEYHYPETIPEDLIKCASYISNLFYSPEEYRYFYKCKDQRFCEFYNWEKTIMDIYKNDGYEEAIKICNKLINQYGKR